MIDRLEARRYVRRVSSPGDRRQVLVERTPLLLRRARQLYGDGSEVAQALARYSVSELTLLRDFVRSDRELNERRARELAGSSGAKRPRPRARRPSAAK